MPAGGASGFAIYGHRKVARNVELFVGRKVEAGRVETGRQAELMGRLATTYVPKDTGALAESIEVSEITEGPRNAGRDVGTGRFRHRPLGHRVSVGGDNVNPKSGQPTSSYAAPVHETHPTKAKFLERAVATVSRQYSRSIASAMRGA